MNLNTQARTAYATAASPTRTARGTEYAVFAQVTHRLSAVDETDKTKFPILAAAIFDNTRLWGTLAEDLLGEGNALPVPLRVQLVGLAEFVRKHSRKVMAGTGSIAPLIDINTSIMRGLRGKPEPVA